jgi:hypothetical protein
MLFNATFNNILVVSWQSVLLVKETDEKKDPGENHRPANKIFYHIMFYQVHRVRTLVVKNTDYRVSFKATHHVIKTTIPKHVVIFYIYMYYK